MNLENKLKEIVISTYQKAGDTKMIASGDKVYSGNYIADEIRKETEFGIHILSGLLRLTIDLVSRDKLNL